MDRTQAAQQSVIKFITIIGMNVVTPKGAAKNELLFSKSASGVCTIKLFTAVIYGFL